MRRTQVKHSPLPRQRDSEVALEFSETHNAGVRAHRCDRSVGGHTRTVLRLGAGVVRGYPKHGKSTELLCAAPKFTAVNAHARAAVLLLVNESGRSKLLQVTEPREAPGTRTMA